MSNAADFLHKAHESLAGAESEYNDRRFNSCANRRYYACFQAALAALRSHGVQARSGNWSHGGDQAEFSRQFIRARKVFPAELSDTLSRNLDLRHVADYETDEISEISAARAVRRARTFVAVVSSEVQRRR